MYTAEPVNTIKSEQSGAGPRGTCAEIVLVQTDQCHFLLLIFFQSFFSN
jgi:hypothetical protein